MRMKNDELTGAHKEMNRQMTDWDEATGEMNRELDSVPQPCEAGLMRIILHRAISAVQTGPAG